MSDLYSLHREALTGAEKICEDKHLSIEEIRVLACLSRFDLWGAIITAFFCGVRRGHKEGYKAAGGYKRKGRR